MPVETYERWYKLIYDELYKYDPSRKIQLSYSMQTNATLITDAWCEHFKRYKVNVGVSIDGPEFLHNKNRVYKNGQGSFENAMRGFELLKKHALPLVSIAVLTEESLNHPDDLFHFFKENEFNRVGFNLEEIENHNTTSFMQIERIEEKYIDFMSRFWDLCQENGYPFKVREFENFTTLLQRLPATASDKDIKKPFSHITVAANGDFSTFCPELLTAKSTKYGDFVFGNVNTHKLEEILTTEKFLNVYRDIVSGVDKCEASCQFYNVCYGGFPANKHSEFGTMNTDETLNCKFRTKLLYETLVSKLENHLLNLEKTDNEVDVVFHR